MRRHAYMCMEMYLDGLSEDGAEDPCDVIGHGRAFPNQCSMREVREITGEQK